MTDVSPNESMRPQQTPRKTFLTKDEITAGIRADLFPSKETIPIATRTPLFNLEGQINDILFEQNSHSVRLKDILPGDYVIQFTHYTKKEIEEKPSRLANFVLDTKTVTINDGGFEQQSNINLSLLHEVGHYLDHEGNKQMYHDMQRSKCEAFLHMMAYSSARRVDVDSSERLKDMMKWVDKVENYSLWLPLDERREIANSYTLFCEGLLSELDSDILLAQLLKADREYGISDVNILIKNERGAWAQALHAINMFNKQGIHLVGYEDKLIRKAVIASLATHESNYLNYTEKGKGFLHKEHPVHDLWDAPIDANVS